ncbi:MAG: Inner membrane protein YbhN [Paracidovorax wautersii]|uniref:Inner membrane protein YbhN n=1 Tax=Paracidovorax wautersii TaxID=1177982 RepID=A0A7V8FSI1_9BURK|nr:MAG: Inner membrane protein YbhN [Paracidovorax wautersii]
MASSDMGTLKNRAVPRSDPHPDPPVRLVDRAPPGRLARLRARPWWSWLTRGLAAVFLTLVAVLLLRLARGIDWLAVWQAFRALPLPAVAAAAGLCAASHLVYSTFDLFGRRYSGHRLSVAQTLGITLVSYPFTLNLGSIVGGASARYRLYSLRGVRLGQIGQIGQIVGLSIVTNWLGYFALAGGLVWLWQPSLPDRWQLGHAGLQAMGVLLAALVVGYVALCVWRRGRPLMLRGHAFPLPGWRAALLQTALSALNWSLMGTAVWVLTQQQVPFAAGLATVMLGAVVGLVSRVPAGLGVIEVVGTAILAVSLPRAEALAAVLAYRTLYFFAPLVLAAVAFGVLELRQRQRQRRKA